MNKILGTAHF